MLQEVALNHFSNQYKQLIIHDDHDFLSFLFTIFIILHYFLYDAINMMLKLLCSFVWFMFKNHYLIVDAYFVTYFPIAVLLWNASGIYTKLAVYY